MRILRPKIIGIVLGLGLALALAPNTHAFYSSVLSKETSQIKQHINAARQQNGNGTWLSAMEQQEAANKEIEKRNSDPNNRDKKATGLPGLFSRYYGAVQEIFIQSFTESLKDGFKYLIPAFAGVTTCLRDDVWGLQALQEEVLNELLKSSLLNDFTNSTILWADYKMLQDRLDGKSLDNDKKRIYGIQVD